MSRVDDVLSTRRALTCDLEEEKEEEEEEEDEEKRDKLFHNNRPATDGLQVKNFPLCVESSLTSTRPFLSPHASSGRAARMASLDARTSTIRLLVSTTLHLNCSRLEVRSTAKCRL